MHARTHAYVRAHTHTQREQANPMRDWRKEQYGLIADEHELTWYV